MNVFPLFSKIVFVILLSALWCIAQPSAGSIHGRVLDQNGDAIARAGVTARNTATGLSLSIATNDAGRYRFDRLPTGTYELRFEAANFSRFERRGVLLEGDQEAVVDATLQVGDVRASVTVDENASLLNTASSEVATRFDEKRLTDLPVAANRNVLSLLLSVSGVNQLGNGQSQYAAGINFSANGARIRSNSFLLDGQDLNDPVFTGTGLALNNPDAIQEIRIVTNQFKAEYGRNAGSVTNVVGKSGTNEYHGSAFWFHNNERLNSCSNLDKVASLAPTGYCDPSSETEARRRAPKRLENQLGFTIGGPVSMFRFGDGVRPAIWSGKDRTFFFGDFQRWTDRSRNSGVTLLGAPTTAGRAALASVAASRPQVEALLNFVPAGAPNGSFAVFTIPGGSQQLVELGSLTGSAPLVFNDRQGSFRIDHRINEKNSLWARYRADSQRTVGGGQVTPPGHSVVNFGRAAIVSFALNTSLFGNLSNEAKFAWFRYRTGNDAVDPASKSIPSISIPGLGMVNSISISPGISTRTALGLPSTLPGSRRIKAYQIADSISYLAGDHIVKFGAEVRSNNARIIAFQNARGIIQYDSPSGPPGAPINISNFVNDIAASATINFPVPGGEPVARFEWKELYGYVQDDWRLSRSLTLNLGIRYEYPGNSFSFLDEVNEEILAANGNDPAYRYGGSPRPDTNNFMPRIGFSWNPRTRKTGLLGALTGGDRLVVRGGYARAYDAGFVNINANLYSAFPFLVSNNALLNGAYAAIRNATPVVTNPRRISRWTIEPDFRAPAADQFSLDLQREISTNVLIQVGYIRTRGTGLFQIIDANPCRPGRNCRPPNFGNRVDPTLEVVRRYTNASASTYDALSVSVTKRLSKGFSAGLHYTWSTFIDDGSDVFSPSTSELSVAQNPFDLRSERARSSYDRPQRVTGNFVYELPFIRRQNSLISRFVGGWQLNSFFTFQSGAPFSVSLGADPQCSVCGIATAVRPNLLSTLDLSRMSVPELLSAGGRSLFGSLPVGQRVGNAGRNILRAAGLGLVDIGFLKNMSIAEGVRFQLRADLFNAFNSRNFGIPPASIDSVAFLNQWTTDGGSRRIRLGARLAF